MPPAGLRFLRAPVERSNGFDLTLFAQWEASRESAELLNKSFQKAKNCYSQKGLLQWALAQTKPGLALEFGVFRGQTLSIIAKGASEVVGFDTFRGTDLPWRYDINMNHFDLKGAIPKVPANAKLVIGKIEETLERFLDENPAPIRFVHIDTDVYAPCSFVLETLKKRKRLLPGTVIVFDEFWNYPGWKEHEFKAFQEMEAKGLKTEFIGFASSHLSVAVRVLE